MSVDTTSRCLLADIPSLRQNSSDALNMGLLLRLRYTTPRGRTRRWVGIARRITTGDPAATIHGGCRSWNIRRALSYARPMSPARSAGSRPAAGWATPSPMRWWECRPSMMACSGCGLGRCCSACSMSARAIARAPTRAPAVGRLCGRPPGSLRGRQLLQRMRKTHLRLCNPCG